MAILNAFTFTATSTEPLPWDATGTRERGTVEATIGNDTCRVEAVRYENGKIISWAFTGRYHTGTKAWPATVCLWGFEGMETVCYGRDHHSNRCHKTGISFA